jgi:two-component system chemotaxis response regulator CheY
MQSLEEQMSFYASYHQDPRNKATPIILISTESTERDREKGLALGASAYVAKPFSPEELAAHVSRLAGS